MTEFSVGVNFVLDMKTASHKERDNFSLQATRLRSAYKVDGGLARDFTPRVRVRGALFTVPKNFPWLTAWFVYVISAQTGTK